jgi:crotonobetainyl-CoA:carnitine CoA-transferase CaiB-like acyl-CoA transferase
MMMAGPLTGLKVLDLSRVLAGPWSAQILADLGAEVIKIERLEGGDDTRSWGPPFVEAEKGGLQGDAAYYLSANRGKKSLCVDIAKPEGQALVQRLAQRCDIVLENFKCGDLARYGLDYQTLSGLNPKLIYCSITGFGQSGPNAMRAGYDYIMQGMAGLMSITGTPESGPLKVGVAIADLATGLYATIAILAALHHRQATGVGQHLDLALFDVQLALLANQNMNALVGGMTPGLMGNAHPNLVPYEDFATSDGRIIIAVGNNMQFAKLCTLLGAPEWAQDARFAVNSARVANRSILVALIQQALHKAPSAYWLEAFENDGIPAGPIQTIPQALASAQAQARALLVTQAHPIAGNLTTVANPIKFSQTPLEYPQAPPTLGAQTLDILQQELGLESQAIAALVEGKVIKLG